LVIGAPGIDFVNLDEVSSNDFVDSPSDQETGNIWEDLNPRTYLTELFGSFKHCHLCSCSGYCDRSREAA
jgi:hypothetical protein